VSTVAKIKCQVLPKRLLKRKEKRKKKREKRKKVPLGEVGNTRQGSCFAGCMKKNDKRFYDSSLMGKIYSCYNTLHLESRRVGTFA
jgi:hypothetical protein